MRQANASFLGESVVGMSKMDYRDRGEIRKKEEMAFLLNGILDQN